jgi:TIR domain
MTQIMISYRRDDTTDVTGRIYDRLTDAFGKESVFRDVDSIPLGVNFKQYLDATISQCRALVVVIGRKWLTIADASGRRRLDDPRDVVRLEIQTALERKLAIVPVLVQGASMPEDATLPAAIRELALCNGATIGQDPHFDGDIERLIRNLEAIAVVSSPGERSVQRARRTELANDGRGEPPFWKAWTNAFAAALIGGALSVMASFFFYTTLGAPLTSQETVVVFLALFCVMSFGQHAWARIQRVKKRR